MAEPETSRIGSEFIGFLGEHGQAHDVSFATAIDGFAHCVRLGGMFELAERNHLGVACIGSAVDGGSRPLSEQLLDAYQHSGISFLNHCDRECAFIVWDRLRNQIFLGRDATGMCPLFVTVSEGACRFASSIAALARSGTPLRLEEQQVARWLSLYTDERRSTLFVNVLSLVPGSLYTWQQGRLVCCSEWRPDLVAPLRCRDRRDYEEGLYAVLETAIRDRLPRCGPVVSSLSGGLDSTSVTSILGSLCASSGQSVHAITAVPEFASMRSNSLDDERAHASSVVSMFPGMRHHLVCGFREPVFTAMDRFSSAQGEPVWNLGTCGWFQQLGTEAHALGATMFFVGSAGNLTISRTGTAAVRAYAREGKWTHASVLAWRMFREKALSGHAALRQLTGPLVPHVAEQLTREILRKPEPPISLIHARFAEEHGVSPQQASKARRRYTFRNQLLRKLRFCDPGAISFAMRQVTGAGYTDPTADRRVVEFCWSLPEEVFCTDGVPRSLIRNTMRNLLPARVVDERRRGRQDTDIAFHMDREKHALFREIRRMKEIDFLRHAIDFATLEAMLGKEETFTPDRGNPAFWPKAIRALSLGRFVRRHYEGTLFQ